MLSPYSNLLADVIYSPKGKVNTIDEWCNKLRTKIAGESIKNHSAGIYLSETQELLFAFPRYDQYLFDGV